MVLFFILRFFAVYTILTVVYQKIILTKSNVDFFTLEVTKEVTKVSSIFITNLTYKIFPKHNFCDLIYKENVILRIIEGCNGISVIILFSSFIIAFKGKLKKLFWFIPFGIITVHIFNILRIFILILIVIYRKEWFENFHKFIFPSIIYGIIFLLWMLWVSLNKINKKNG